MVVVVVVCNIKEVGYWRHWASEGRRGLQRAAVSCAWKCLAQGPKSFPVTLPGNLSEHQP